MGTNLTLVILRHSQGCQAVPGDPVISDGQSGPSSVGACVSGGRHDLACFHWATAELAAGVAPMAVEATGAWGAANSSLWLAWSHT